MLWLSVLSVSSAKAASVWGDVCPLRVCSEAEDTHGGMVKVPPLAVPQLGSCAPQHAPSTRLALGGSHGVPRRSQRPSQVRVLPLPRVLKRAASQKPPITPHALTTSRHNCSLWHRSGQDRLPTIGCPLV